MINFVLPHFIVLLIYDTTTVTRKSLDGFSLDKHIANRSRLIPVTVYHDMSAKLIK